MSTRICWLMPAFSAASQKLGALTVRRFGERISTHCSPSTPPEFNGGNSAADSGQLPIVLAAVARDAGAAPRQVLADAGYRSEATFEQSREHPAELIVALGREGKKDVKVDARKRPLCAAMAEKFTSAQTTGGLSKAQMAVRTAERLGKKRSRISTIQHARTGQGPARVEAHLRGAEPAQNVENDAGVSPEGSNLA